MQVCRLQSDRKETMQYEMNIQIGVSNIIDMLLYTRMYSPDAIAYFIN